jgi:hypothetical protein
MIVPTPPGNITDVFGRIMADRMKRSLGQPIIIENWASSLSKSSTGSISSLVATRQEHQWEPRRNAHVAAANLRVPAGARRRLLDALLAEVVGAGQDGCYGGGRVTDLVRLSGSFGLPISIPPECAPRLIGGLPFLKA